MTTSTVTNSKSAIQSNFELLDGLCADLKFIPEISGVIRRTLPSIRRKYESPELVMAVMGEFSAGKSTLINAILGEPLLTAKVRPTTAIATFIRYGRRPSATVFFPDGASKRVRLSNLEPFLTGEIDVSRVELAFPNPLLKQGLVIIDTPGSNVDNPRHIQRARDAISQANTCMFVFDGKQPFSKSSAEYLDEVRRNIFKFVFVMTKADELDDDEIEDAREYARSQIASRMDDPSTEVIAVSAKRMLDGKRELSNVDCLWNALQHLMTKDKNRVILDEILRLERNLLRATDDVLKTREELYEDEMRRLLGREITVDGIRMDALRNIRHDAEMLVHRYQQRYATTRAQEIEACRRELVKLVFSASNMSELKAYAQGMEAGFQSMATSFTQMLNESLSNCCELVADIIRGHFKCVFLDLKRMRDAVTTTRRLLVRWMALGGVGLAVAVATYLLIANKMNGGHVWIPLLSGLIASVITGYLTAQRDLVALGLSSVTLAPAMVLPDLGSKAFTNIGIDAEVAGFGGAVVGAGIGTAVGGPIGGILGGLIGAAIGAFAGTSLETAKEKLAAKVNASIDEFDALSLSQSTRAWANFKSSLHRELELQVDIVMRSYRQLLDDVLRHQVHQKQLLQSQREAVTNARRRLAGAIERTNSALRAQ